MIFIIKWHYYPWKKKKINYGRRMCELLFVSSGFLVGYNYYKKDVPDNFTYSFKYIYKHLRIFYPLNLINIIFGAYLSKKKLDKRHIDIFIIKVLLLDSWTRYDNKVNLYQGIAWFLSSLLFCYFLTPFLLKGIKKIKTSTIIFIIVALIRIEIEEHIKKTSINLLDVQLHRGPVIRCMEFYLGMLIIPSFFKLKTYFDEIKDKYLIKILFSIIQITAIIIIYYLMIKYNDILLRCYFVLFFCVFIFVIGFDYGYLSNVISNNIFKFILSCQMEMYLFQSTINEIIINNKIDKKWKFLNNTEIEFNINLIIVFIVSFVYKSLFKQNLAKVMDFIVKIIKKIIK